MSIAKFYILFKSGNPWMLIDTMAKKGDNFSPSWHLLSGEFEVFHSNSIQKHLKENQMKPWNSFKTDKPVSVAMENFRNFLSLIITIKMSRKTENSVSVN